jgi:hypothetical protein
MTIPLDKFKARLLAKPKVKAEYDAFAPKIETKARTVRRRASKLPENRRRQMSSRRSRTAAGS